MKDENVEEKIGLIYYFFGFHSVDIYINTNFVSVNCT